MEERSIHLDEINLYGLVALLLKNLWVIVALCLSAVLCFMPVAVGVAVYFVAVVLLKTIKKEDCLLLPKGQKIAKMLHL